jgi:hypothetical protein
MRGLEDNVRAIENIWKDPVARVKYFFDEAPYHSFRGKGQSVEAYQLGTYLALWGELYGFPSGVREIAATGRGTGKTTIFQELNAADMAVFMPYFLQTFYGEKKPIDVTLIFVANVKKGARQRLENVKRKISGNAYLERHLVDYNAWTKEEVILRNGTMLRAESASDRVRGYHSKHQHGKVIYLCDEFAFWGGSQCMDGQKFIEEIAEQSFGATIGCFTTPYGKRGGAWWAYNHPDWFKFNFPTWQNPRADRRKLAAKVKRLLSLGRTIIVDQEIRGRFVDDVGLFFPIETWMKSINTGLEWLFTDQDNYVQVVKELSELAERRVKHRGHYLLGLDPNEGNKKAGADPFGISLVEKVGRKYFNRFTTSFNGRSHEEIMRVLKPLCAIYEPVKINIDGGGGYHTGPSVMLKGSPGVRNIEAIPESNQSIVGYMSALRGLMMMGKYEQPDSESLRESQMAMQSIGDQETRDESETTGTIKFQTRGKKSGIPCDLAAMGLAVARENIGRHELATESGTVNSKDSLSSAGIETKRVLHSLDRLGDLGLVGINATLTKAGV